MREMVQSMLNAGNMQYKRITLFAGHYGSGKTNIAVNYALGVKASGRDVVLADLDIVNPYFRTKDSEGALRSAGIQLISSRYANSNVDVPSIPPEAYSITDRRDRFAVVDVGGDDRGALALGRYTPAILEENDFELLFVINKFRPLTRTASDTLDVMREIERACSLKFSAIVNNSNLGAATTAADVLDTVSYAEDVSRWAGIPVKMTTATEAVCEGLIDKIDAVYPIKLFFKSEWVL